MIDNILCPGLNQTTFLRIKCGFAKCATCHVWFVGAHGRDLECPKCAAKSALERQKTIKAYKRRDR